MNGKIGHRNDVLSRPWLSRWATEWRKYMERNLRIVMPLATLFLEGWWVYLYVIFVNEYILSLYWVHYIDFKKIVKSDIMTCQLHQNIQIFRRDLCKTLIVLNGEVKNRVTFMRFVSGMNRITPLWLWFHNGSLYKWNSYVTIKAIHFCLTHYVWGLKLQQWLTHFTQWHF